jgi:DNA-binding HxlR family transcriptional regulator
MLSQLLSSKPKTQLINLFLAHSGRSFSFTELRVNSRCPSKLLKQTLKELDKIEFLSVTVKNKIKYYQMNKHFALYPELVNLLRKVKNIPSDDLVKQAAKVGHCKLIALTGVFVGKPRIETDVLFVGKVNSRKLAKILALAEKYAEQEISYTIFSPQEFEYRKIMNDRFVKNILENNPVFVLDKTKTRTTNKIIYKL